MTNSRHAKSMARFTKNAEAMKALAPQQAEPSTEWPLIKNILDEYGLDAIAFVAAWKAVQQRAESLSMRMPKVGDKVICLEDESLGEVVSLTGGGSPDITFDDGTRGTYLLREFAELFGYAEQRQQQAEPPPQRQWQGLTIDEVMSVLDHCEDSRIAVARDVEAKLKERNT